MNKLGTSYISKADMWLFIGALFLVVSLLRLPRHTIWSRIAVVVYFGVVFAIIVIMILADNLNENALRELSLIAMALCVVLWNWNEGNVKGKEATKKKSLSRKAR